MRRQADVTVSNVTMPAVSWNNRFGEQNISVDLGRMILNSFQIEKGVVSYSICLYVHGAIFAFHLYVQYM